MFQTSMREQGFRHRGSNQLGGFVSHWTVAARTTGEAPLGGRVGFPKLRLDPDHVEEVVELSDVANVMGCLLEKFSTQTQHVAFPGAQDPCNTCPVPPTGLSQVFRLSGLGFISIRCLKFNFGGPHKRARQIGNDLSSFTVLPALCSLLCRNISPSPRRIPGHYMPRTATRGAVNSDSLIEHSIGWLTVCLSLFWTRDPLSSLYRSSFRLGTLEINMLCSWRSVCCAFPPQALTVLFN